MCGCVGVWVYTFSCLPHRMVGQLYCGLSCNMISHHVVKPYSLSAGHSSSVDSSSECSALCIASVAQYTFDQVSHFICYYDSAVTNPHSLHRVRRETPSG